jgi:hypothetical protein
MRARMPVAFCRPEELFSVSGRLVLARSRRRSRNVTLVRGRVHCEGMNDVAIIAAALCCAAEGGGPRNGEAFNEIICAPSLAVRAVTTARLKFHRAPKSLIFIRLLFRAIFSRKSDGRYCKSQEKPNS